MGISIPNTTYYCGDEREMEYYYCNITEIEWEWEEETIQRQYEEIGRIEQEEQKIEDED
jgi:hypothetical protein